MPSFTFLLSQRCTWVGTASLRKIPRRNQESCPDSKQGLIHGSHANREPHISYCFFFWATLHMAFLLTQAILFRAAATDGTVSCATSQPITGECLTFGLRVGSQEG
jgi:hypothetical protein